MGVSEAALVEKTALPEKAKLRTANIWNKATYALWKLWLYTSSSWQARSCTQVGRRFQVEGKLVVENYGRIIIGDKVRIRAKHVPVELGAFPDGVLEIGDDVFINSGVTICSQTHISIGRNVAIGNYTVIMDTDFHAVEDHTQAGVSRPVTIADDVWIGTRVTILKGVTIGRGAVIAAGAVVTRDVPAKTVVGGIPARILRTIGETGEESSRSYGIS